MSSSLSAYNDVRIGLESIFRSRLQMQILLSLGDGCKTLSQLRQITGSSSQALIPRIRLLENRLYISSQRFQYCLTPVGKILTTKITEFTRLLSVITRHETFWHDHHLEGIPEPFINEISDLYHSQVIADTSLEFFQVYTQYLTMIREAQYICWITPFVSQDHIRALAHKNEEGIPVEMVVTPEIDGQLKREPYVSSIKEMDSGRGFIRYVSNDPLKFGIMLSDTRLLFGLYKKDMQSFDASSHFVSSDPQALSWGERICTYYKSRADKV